MNASPKIALIGAGGHAKVVISTLQAVGRTLITLFDDDKEKWGSELLGIPIVGPVESLIAKEFDLGLITIGSNSRRNDIAGTVSLEWERAVHPAAYVHASVVLGPGTVVFAGATIQPDTVVGNHVIVNTGASLDHDCRIGDFAHIAPGVSLCGAVEVGEGALLGVGSSATPGIEIGSWSTVGAGAVVVEDLPAGSVAAGVPARSIERQT